MARLRDLEPAVRTHLTGVSEPTIRLYVRRATKQFCQDTKIWDVNIGSKSLSPTATPDLRRRIAVPSTASGDTDFELPDQSFLNSISRVRYGSGADVEPEKLPDAEWAYDIATRELVLEPGVVFQDMTIYVDAILEPSQTALQLPDWMAELWGEVISDYAVFEIMSQPNQEWSNPRLAAVFKGKYDSRVSEATVAKARKGSRQPIRSRPIPFN